MCSDDGLTAHAQAGQEFGSGALVLALPPLQSLPRFAAAVRAAAASNCRPPHCVYSELNGSRGRLVGVVLVAPRDVFCKGSAAVAGGAMHARAGGQVNLQGVLGSWQPPDMLRTCCAGIRHVPPMAPSNEDGWTPLTQQLTRHYTAGPLPSTTHLWLYVACRPGLGSRAHGAVA